jgi:hypothetical protein
MSYGESMYDEQQLPFEQPWKTWDREVRLRTHGRFAPLSTCSSPALRR